MYTRFYQPTKISLAIFIGLIFFGSCQKPTKNDDVCPLNMSAIAGNYVLIAIKYKATATSPEQDYMIFMEACEKDDIITLNGNGTYSYTDAGSVCSPDGNDSGSWSLSGNTIISDGVVAGTVEKFDCTTLVVYTSDLNFPGDRLTITIKRK
jgi:hypothetical protein